MTNWIWAETTRLTGRFRSSRETIDRLIEHGETPAVIVGN
jgi:hypothetical protein